MNLIKGFFSKIFAQKNQDELSMDGQDNSLLKETARNTVLDAFQNKPEEKPLPSPSPLPSEVNAKILKKLDEYNDVFFREFNVPKTNYHVKIDKKNIIVQVDDKNFEASLSKSDKISYSYEHIFQRLIQEEFKSFEYRVILQSGHSAKKHHAHISAVAKKLATKVKKTGRKVVITSKSSYERSIIHGVVEKIPGISSKSTGPYHQRRLVISPDKNVTQHITHD